MTQPVSTPWSHPKRRLKNFLLDRKFQLKYTSMVVFVTLVVAIILGYLAYDFSRGQSQALTIQMAMQPDLDPRVAEDLQGLAEDYDRQVLLGIAGGILFLVLSLGLTGIIVTHRLIGPIYKIKRMLGEVGAGQMVLEGKLRKNDEFQDLFEAFATMVDSMRERQRHWANEVDITREQVRAHKVPDEILHRLDTISQELRKGLERNSLLGS